MAREFYSNVDVGEGHGKVLVFTSADSWGELPRAALQKFLDGIKSLNSEQLIEFFTENAHFTDAAGKRWDREGILKNFETLFAPYAKRNAASSIEGTNANTSTLLTASVLWKNAIFASEQRVWVHRMSIVLIRENADWKILLMHVTPVQVP